MVFPFEEDIRRKVNVQYTISSKIYYDKLKSKMKKTVLDKWHCFMEKALYILCSEVKDDFFQLRFIEHHIIIFTQIMLKKNNESIIMISHFLLESSTKLMNNFCKTDSTITAIYYK